MALIKNPACVDPARNKLPITFINKIPNGHLDIANPIELGDDVIIAIKHTAR